MKKNPIYLFSICILSFLLSCTSTQKLNTLKPEPDDATPLTYESTPSFINIPVTVKIKDLENQTNFILTDIIYQDDDITDDNIKMKIQKTAPITIKNISTPKNTKLEITLPLKSIISYRLGTKKMGIDFYNTRDFNLDGVVTLISDVSFQNWKVSSKTSIKSLQWNSSPTMTILGKNMPVTYLVDPAISMFKTDIEKSIDEAVEKSMDFKPQVLTAVKQITTPFLMSEEYQSWLRIHPIEIYSTAATAQKDAIVFDMGMKCEMETIIGKKPNAKFNPEDVVLKAVTKIPKQVTTTIAAISSYSDASQLMTRNFSGQEFGSGNKKITVQNVSIWHKDDKLIIALDVIGSINGSIYLSGLPQYDSKSNELYFDQLDYVLDTKNKLMKTANWLMQGYILKKIKENCRYSIATNMTEGRKNIMSYLTNYSPVKGVFINGKIETLTFDKIKLTNQAIIAFLTVNGTVNISINGLQN